MDEAQRKAAAELELALLRRAKEMASDAPRDVILTAFSWALAEHIAAYPVASRPAIAERVFAHMVDRVNTISKSGRKPLSTRPRRHKMN